MHKKTISIAGLIIVVIITAIVFATLLFKQSTPSNPQTTAVDTEALFPSGESRSINFDSFVASSSGSNNRIDNVSIAGFKQLVTTPIAGAAVINNKSGDTLVYMERGTGHVYAFAGNGNEPVRLSNTTMPRNYEAYWGSDVTGLRFISQSIGDNSFTTTIGTISDKSTTTDAGAILTPLADPLESIAVFPNKNQFAMLNSSQSGSVISIADFDRRKVSLVTSTPLKEILLSWPATNTITLQTKPSAKAPGYLFFVTLKGVWTRILGDLNGLTTTVSPDTNKILYSISHNRSIDTSLYNRKTGVSSPLTIKTLADKCIWTSKNIYIICAAPSTLPALDYPDAWYQGKTFFTDSFWLINSDTGEAKELFNPQAVNNSISVDAINLFLDSSGNFLFFTDKHDNSLWVLDLSVYVTNSDGNQDSV